MQEGGGKQPGHAVGVWCMMSLSLFLPHLFPASASVSRASSSFLASSCSLDTRCLTRALTHTARFVSLNVPSHMPAIAAAASLGVCVCVTVSVCRRVIPRLRRLTGRLLLLLLTSVRHFQSIRITNDSIWSESSRSFPLAFVSFLLLLFFADLFIRERVRALSPRAPTLQLPVRTLPLQ